MFDLVKKNRFSTFFNCISFKIIKKFYLFDLLFHHRESTTVLFRNLQKDTTKDHSRTQPEKFGGQ